MKQQSPEIRIWGRYPAPISSVTLSIVSISLGFMSCRFSARIGQSVQRVVPEVVDFEETTGSREPRERLPAIRSLYHVADDCPPEVGPRPVQHVHHFEDPPVITTGVNVDGEARTLLR